MVVDAWIAAGAENIVIVGDLNATLGNEAALDASALNPEHTARLWFADRGLQSASAGAMRGGNQLDYIVSNMRVCGATALDASNKPGAQTVLVSDHLFLAALLQPQGAARREL